MIDKLRKDVPLIKRVLGSSLKTVGRLAWYDGYEFYRRAAHNRLPFARALLDLAQGRDYHLPGGDVVFLRPGYLTGASCLVELGDLLNANGHGIDNHQYDFTASLESLIERFLVKVNDIAEDNGGTVKAAGHSKGGLEILGAYRQRPELFDRIVTWAVPYLGSERAIDFPFCKFDSLAEMAPGSEFISWLSDGPLPVNAQILNFYSDEDMIVVPAENSRLPVQDNVTNILLPGLFHNDFLYDPIAHHMTRLFLAGSSFGNGYVEELKSCLGREYHPRVDVLFDVNGLT
jgi:hypothetical protein